MIATGGFGQHPQRRLAGECPLPHALGPGDQPGVVQVAAMHGGGECLTSRFVA